MPLYSLHIFHLVVYSHLFTHMSYLCMRIKSTILFRYFVSIFRNSCTTDPKKIFFADLVTFLCKMYIFQRIRSCQLFWNHFDKWVDIGCARDFKMKEFEFQTITVIIWVVYQKSAVNWYVLTGNKMTNVKRSTSCLNYLHGELLNNWFALVVSSTYEFA